MCVYVCVLLHAFGVCQVQQGDSLGSLAALFRTTVKKLLSVNPDVLIPSSLVPGQPLCVLPCTTAAYLPTDGS